MVPPPFHAIPCLNCGAFLDFHQTMDLFVSDGTKITFGDVWVLRCGHMGVFECPAPNCPTLYRSVRSCGIWTILPDETGIVQDLKLFAKEYGSSNPGLWLDVPHGTLSDLDAMGMSLQDLLAANDAYLHLESAAMLLAVEYTTSFVQNSYIIDEIIAETLVSHPALPPNCIRANHLYTFSTVDDDEGREPFRVLILVTSKCS
ncbi:hypothetical protein IW262DRAFT_1296332 [Armillaria fumosa]|nr:hypothetical protein IW262DRAFT_1296332 [Armillaria fumosa]